MREVSSQVGSEFAYLENVTFLKVAAAAAAGEAENFTRPKIAYGLLLSFLTQVFLFSGYLFLYFLNFSFFASKKKKSKNLLHQTAALFALHFCCCYCALRRRKVYCHHLTKARRKEGCFIFILSFSYSSVLFQYLSVQSHLVDCV